MSIRTPFEKLNLRSFLFYYKQKGLPLQFKMNQLKYFCKLILKTHKGKRE